jgi:hypothetical protein
MHQILLFDYNRWNDTSMQVPTCWVNFLIQNINLDVPIYIDGGIYKNKINNELKKYKAKMITIDNDIENSFYIIFDTESNKLNFLLTWS